MTAVQPNAGEVLPGPVTSLTTASPLTTGSPLTTARAPALTASVRRAALTAARALLTIGVVVAVGYATVAQWSEVRSYLLSLSWPSVVLSGLMVMVGLAAATLGWRASLTAVGHPLPMRSASRIYLVGLLAKYLPGSVWAYVLQMELGKKANLPRSVCFLAAMLLTGVSTTVALGLGLLALPALRDVSAALAVALIPLVVAALVCVQPLVLTWLLRRVMALFRRPVLAQPLTWRSLAPVVGWCLLTWSSFGFHLWWLANAAAAPGLGGIFRSTGAVALGLTMGMLAFLLPSGLGVREAVITAALLPYTSAGTALGMALASRLIFTVGEVTAAGLTILPWGRSRALSLKKIGSLEPPR